MRAFIHMPETILGRVTEQMKIAMKARKKERVAALRLMLAELKNVEIDERIELDDLRTLAILDKMSKQRNDSKEQYREAGRKDLEEKEGFELSVIEEFMPEKLGEKVDGFFDGAERCSGIRWHHSCTCRHIFLPVVPRWIL